MTKDSTQRCQTCGHKVLGPGVKLSSIEFRRKINSITSIKELDDCKDYLIHFVKNRIRITSSVDEFLNKLEAEKTNTNSIDAIKTWILEYPDLLRGNNPESPLYDLIRLNYSNGIDMSFHDFYQDYANSYGALCKSNKVPNPLSKNHISRALNALGIKPIMKKATLVSLNRSSSCYNKLTSIMMIYITKEELSEVLKKNGLSSAS